MHLHRRALLLLLVLLPIGCARNYTGGRAAERAAAERERELRLRVASDELELAAAGSPEFMGDLLQRVSEAVHLGAEIHLRPGRYVLSPVEFTDTSCGNCQDAQEDVPATYGLRLSGERVRLVGEHPDSVIIETRAGYGIFFDGCTGCELVGVTVTGGERDADGRATDAAVVVRDSDVRMRDCVLRDNIGDPTTVAATTVGIAGIAGREGARIDVEGCRIQRNSWDGIALYRGAEARIHDNLIDGVDAARGAGIGGGRGVGIGLTWDARAEVVGNRVTRYWKGIGVFVDADANVRENVVEDVLTWGIAFWSAAQGSPVATIEGNAVFRAGACGVMIDGEPPASDSARADGRLTANAIAQATRDERYDSGEPYCTQRPIALHWVPPGFAVADNLLWGSRQPGEAPAATQLERAAFRQAVQPLIARLRTHPPTAGSAFVREFGAP